MNVRVYGLPHCSTCRKVLAHLEDRGVEIEEFRDLKVDPLAPEEVRELAKKVGGADVLFSRRARKYRALGLHEQGLSESDLLRLMSEEYTFITRPVVVAGGRAVAGSSTKRLDPMIADVGD